jgi:hypothetical protein
LLLKNIVVLGLSVAFKKYQPFFQEAWMSPKVPVNQIEQFADGFADISGATVIHVNE